MTCVWMTFFGGGGNCHTWTPVSARYDCKRQKSKWQNRQAIVWERGRMFVCVSVIIVVGYVARVVWGDDGTQTHRDNWLEQSLNGQCCLCAYIRMYTYTHTHRHTPPACLCVSLLIAAHYDDFCLLRLELCVTLIYICQIFKQDSFTKLLYVRDPTFMYNGQLRHHIRAR